MALALGATWDDLGFEALANPRGTKFGIPFVVFFMFGTVALQGAIRRRLVIRSGGLQRGTRLTRHLWRMCYALWIATASFFLGPRARVGNDLCGTAPHPCCARASSADGGRRHVYWLWRVPRQAQLPRPDGDQRC